MSKLLYARVIRPAAVVLVLMILTVASDDSDDSNNTNTIYLLLSLLSPHTALAVLTGRLGGCLSVWTPQFVSTSLTDLTPHQTSDRRMPP